MARQRDPFVTFAVLGVMGFVGWQWAMTQPGNSSARQTVDRIRGIAKGPHAGTTLAPNQAAPAPAPAQAAPAASAPPASSMSPEQTPLEFPGMTATVLVDFGGFPVVFDGDAGTLRQDPNQGGTNVYGPGDSFMGPDGTMYTWLGRADLLQGSDGSVPSIDQLFA